MQNRMQALLLVASDWKFQLLCNLSKFHREFRREFPKFQATKQQQARTRADIRLKPMVDEHNHLNP